MTTSPSMSTYEPMVQSSPMTVLLRIITKLPRRVPSPMVTSGKIALNCPGSCISSPSWGRWSHAQPRPHAKLAGFAVVDPRRDVDVCRRRATRDLRITHVVETHLHNDYVSGGRELAALTGATHVIGAGAELAYEHRAARDGDAFDVGSIRFRTLDTPGHTPEHVSYAVADTSRADEPFLLLTGGSLLVGAVGRTDLLRVGQCAPLRRGDVPLPSRGDPPAREDSSWSTRPTVPARCVRPGSRRRRGPPSATSDVTTRCWRRWRSTPSRAPFSQASPRSRATSPGCARSTRPGRGSSAASCRRSRRCPGTG